MAEDSSKSAWIQAISAIAVALIAGGVGIWTVRNNKSGETSSGGSPAA